MNLRTHRRNFFRLIPGACAAAWAQPVAAPAKKESLRGAEDLAALEFSGAQESMILPAVERNRANYESLRAIPVPLDVDPPAVFHPVLPGMRAPAPPGAGFVPSKVKAPTFRNVNEVAFCTVSQLAEALRTRKVSSRDLTRMYLERLKEYGPKLNCVITLTEQLALEQADAADSEIRRGKYRGPLHGIPWGAKDLFATKGIPTTWGAQPFRNQVLDYNATVVDRLREAGAVLVAKLALGELAAGGARWYMGMTRNPWNPTDTTVGANGSSSGSAASVSAGLVGFSLGTETLGSILSPCSQCGATGLRPTFGRVSRHGVMNLCWSMDKVGPICRSAEDCALVLHSMYGPDGRDMAVTDLPFAWNPAAIHTKGLRVGWVAAEFAGAGAERERVYGEARKEMQALTADCQVVELPTKYNPCLRIVATAEAASAFDDLTRNGQADSLAGQSASDWPSIFRASRFVPAVEYLRGQRARTLLMREMDRLMSQWDVIVTPAPAGASNLLTNLTGHPAVVVPCGFVDGQPLAIALVGRLYEEATALALASAYEARTPWRTMHPTLKI